MDLLDDILDFDSGDDDLFADDYFEVRKSSIAHFNILSFRLLFHSFTQHTFCLNQVDEPNKAGIWNDWGMSENSNWTHPVYFAKCLSKVFQFNTTQNVSGTFKYVKPFFGCFCTIVGY